MKILYHHRVASKDGQYVHIEGLTRAFIDQGHEIVWVTPRVAEDEKFGGESRSVGNLKKRIPGAVYELLEFGYAFLAFAKLMLAVFRHRPDVIYERYNLYLPSGIWASRLSGIPLISEVNAPLKSERAKNDGIALPWLASWTEGYVWRKADAVLPVTEVLAQHVIERRGHRNGLTVIHNGVHPEMIEPDAAGRERAKQQLGLAGKTVLGFTGFMRDWHGLDSVIRVIANGEQSDWHALLVGDGPARDELQKLAAELGVESQVTFTGLVAREQIKRYIQAFDIALQPKVVPYASPLKMFEYMALGKLIVAPDMANIREILTDDHDAVLFDPEASSAFEAAINTALSDQDLREKLQANVIETLHARRFKWAENAKRVIGIADDLLR
ncbi:MAG: glycosyltransferase family 4 protein [Pseudomonadota bacterium]